MDGPGIRRQLRGRLHVNSQAVPSDNELPMRGNSCYRHLLDGFGSAGLLRAFDQVLQGPLLLMEVRAGRANPDGLEENPQPRTRPGKSRCFPH